PGGAGPTLPGSRTVRRQLRQEGSMPRYVVERTFAGGLQVPADEQGARACPGQQRSASGAGRR
ncbi:MAG TPA: hypothetical protein VF486_25025, partial [Actinomycetes bacterium]